MSNLQKVGGVAALIEAATFIIGFVILVALLGAATDYGTLDITPVENVEFLVDNEAVLYVWYFIIYVVFGIVLVPLVLSLLERTKADATFISRTAAALGIIWAGLVIASGMVANVGAGVVVELYGDDPELAGTVWLSLHFVVDGLGGGNEVVGGLWAVLVSVAALRTGALPNPLNYLGLVAGAAGVLTVIPAAAEALGAVFGLGLIAWFVWLGVVMLRTSEDAIAPGQHVPATQNA